MLPKDTSIAFVGYLVQDIVQASQKRWKVNLKMYEVIEGIYQISSFPMQAINMFLIGETLIDAGIRRDQHQILKKLKGHKVTKHALTHVHPDHQGASHAVCEALNIPLWCSEKEIYAMETGDLSQQIPSNLITKIQHRIWTGEGHPVEKGLREGDSVEMFTVIETPGHSPGHLSFFRESDRVLIVGDVARNIDFLTLQAKLGEAPEMFSMDAELNRKSLKKLASLNPKVVLFGHGQPILDGARFIEFALETIHNA